MGCVLCITYKDMYIRYTKCTHYPKHKYILLLDEHNDYKLATKQPKRNGVVKWPVIEREREKVEHLAWNRA